MAAGIPLLIAVTWSDGLTVEGVPVTQGDFSEARAMGTR